MVFSALAGLACSGLTPVEIPDDKAAYVGAWSGKDTVLLIEQAGTAAWDTKSGGASTSLTGNITFTDGGFSIGFPPMALDFAASEPALAGSTWKMTVNDIDLQRAAAPGEGGGSDAGNDNAAPGAGAGRGGGGGRGGGRR